MIVHMNPEVKEGDPRIEAVVQKARTHSLKPVVHAEPGTTSKPVEIYLKDGEVRASSVPEYPFEHLPGVSQVVRVSPARVSAIMNGNNGDSERHIIQIGSAKVGPNHPCLLVSGQCADDIYTPQTIEVLASHGIRHVRTGWRKPRSSADGFRGFGKKGLERTLSAAKANGIESVWMEVIEGVDIDEVRQVRDQTGYEGQIVLWVGARNGNYRLLEALGKQNEFVVMLKHGLNMKSIDELMNMAGFVLAGDMYWDDHGLLDEKRSLPSGNDKLLFCIRGLENSDHHDPHRFAPNLYWLDELHQRSWVNTVLDPSHMGGDVELVMQCLRDGLTHNPDVVLVESHIKPEEALCDADQAIPLDRIQEVVELVQAHNEQASVAA